MPNPPHEPTDRERKTVESLSAFGIPQEEIAKVVGIDPKTLRLHYRAELDTAEARANAKVGEFLFTAASGAALKPKGGEAAATHADCIRAAIFWLKTRAGWKETDRHEHTGKDGGPIQHEEVGADADAFTRRMARLADAAGAGEGTGDDPGEDEGRA
jgi:hypothetical protein